MPGKILIR